MKYIPKCLRFKVLSLLIAKGIIILLFFLIGGVGIAHELNMGIIEALYLTLLNKNNVLALIFLDYFTLIIGSFIAAFVFYERNIQKFLKKIKVL